MLSSFESIKNIFKNILTSYKPDDIIILVQEKRNEYVVIIAKRIHLFPFRTQKLSSLALMVLGGQPPGRVGRSHVMFQGSSTVEHSAVNR